MSASAPSPKLPLLVAIAVTLLVTLLSVILPLDFAGTAVGATFFATTYLLVLRKDTAHIQAHGLALGGIFEPEPLNLRRIASDAGTAISWCLILALICFPPFWIGFQYWFGTRGQFTVTLGPHGWDIAMANLLAVALPEEMFYRGYLQTQLDAVWTPRLKMFGAKVGWGLLVSSAIFALGHFTTTLQVTRFSVFFPSLVFGWLRARTGGIGAAVLFHAACNIFSAMLSRGYGLITE